MNKNIQDMTYEECIDALDDVIAQLEENTLLLQDAVVLFERGTELYKQAEQRLTSAQVQVEILTQKTMKDFEAEIEDSVIKDAVQDTMFDQE